ncbi:MAG TPA: hypothetical protein VJH67_03770 [Candidatus Paceibacterota bacterium]
MDQSTNGRRKYQAILAVVVIILLTAFLYWNNGSLTKVLPKEENQNTNSILPLSNEEIPSDLPQDIVLDKDAVILSSYTSKTEDGKTQSTISYSSNLTLKAINNLYAKYFLDNNWEVATFDKSFKNIIMTKNGIVVSVVVNSPVVSITSIK